MSELVTSKEYAHFPIRSLLLHLLNMAEIHGSIRLASPSKKKEKKIHPGWTPSQTPERDLAHGCVLLYFSGRQESIHPGDH